jgi:hypothetical protein
MKLKIKYDYFPSWEEVEKGTYTKSYPHWLGPDRQLLDIKNKEYGPTNLLSVFIQNWKYNNTTELSLYCIKHCESFEYSEDGYKKMIKRIEEIVNLEVNKLCYAILPIV